MRHPMLERLRRRRLPAAVSRLTAWARALARGHARIPGDRPAAGVLVTPPRPVPPLRAASASTVVRVLARVGLDVRVLRAAAATARSAAPSLTGAARSAVRRMPAPAARGRGAPHAPVLPTPLPLPRLASPAGSPVRPAPPAPLAVAASRTTVLRLVEHRRRIEGPPWRAPSEPAGMSRQRDGRPAARERSRAARRPGRTALEAWGRPGAAMVLAPGPAAAVAAAAAAASPSPLRVFEPEPRPAAPPVPEVEQLTDEVVRQIDRRIAAHRERLGRI